MKDKRRAFAIHFGQSPFRKEACCQNIHMALVFPIALLIIAVVALLFSEQPDAGIVILANAAVVAAVENLEENFEKFKQANDERLKQIETNGHADPLLEEKVDKINADLGTSQEELHQRMDDQQKIIDRLRLNGGSGSVGAELEEKAAFMSAMFKKPVSIEEYQQYCKDFEAFFKKDSISDFMATMHVGSDPDGGFYVSPDTSGKTAELVYESSPIRQIAGVQEISTDALEGDNDLGQAGAGWVGEQATRPATTTPQTGKWKVEAHEMYAMPEATQKLLDDASINSENWLAKKIAARFGRLEATAFVNGSGVAQPRGFLTYGHGTPSATTWNVIERQPSGAAGAFSGADVFHDVIGLLKSAYLGDAVWVMNRTTLATTRKLKDGQGNYLWESSFQANQPFMLLGHPVVIASDMPAIAANSLSIAFGNFKIGYQIVDRIGIRLLRDPYTNKPYVRFYTTKRVGGDVVNFEAIKLVRFAVAAS